MKKHTINDKSQKLSKDMKKQDLVKVKSDKQLDGEKHLADSPKYRTNGEAKKPSNKKLDSEKFLSKMKHLKTFENFSAE